jgi:L-2-aminoadipate reductase
MPLNPNGKIDKPALPFPDTAQAASAVSKPCGTPSPAIKRNHTEETMQNIWASMLPNAPRPIPLHESFFDLGGHSILATRLIFEIRKVFVVNAPLGLVFDQPTIGGLAAEVDALRNIDLGLVYKSIDSSRPAAAPGVDDAKKSTTALVEYGQDYVNLLPRLRDSYPALAADFASYPLTIFLTGATGFLGAFVLRDLLSRQIEVKKVICLVRASDVEQGTRRLRKGSTDRGVWDEQWIKCHKLEIITGDLSQELFGLGHDQWARVAREADIILHNGALVKHLFLIGSYRDPNNWFPQVHWVYPDEKLRSANVLATLTAVELASTARQKALVFVSSTSAIDTEHYVQLSDSLSQGQSDYEGVPESDDLEGARATLKTGYGQTKWVSEKFLFEAGKRGLRGHIIRPGYVVGDSDSAGGSHARCQVRHWFLFLLVQLRIQTTSSGAWSKAVSSLGWYRISTTLSTWFLSTTLQNVSP